MRRIRIDSIPFHMSFIDILIQKGISEKNEITDEEAVEYIRAWHSVKNKYISAYGKRVIVYGLGLKIYNFFNPDEVSLNDGRLKIVAFCDRDKEIIGDIFMGRRVITPEEISSMDYDIIAVTSTRYFKEIKKDLIDLYSVPYNKVIKMDELDF